VTIPPLFGDILRQILAGQAAIEIVAQIDRRSRLRQRLRAARPDFISSDCAVAKRMPSRCLS
jgi:hypothetical protein